MTGCVNSRQVIHKLLKCYEKHLPTLDSGQQQLGSCNRVSKCGIDENANQPIARNT